MDDIRNTEKIISVIGTNYTNFLVWDLLSQSYDAYKKVQYASKRFQSSIWEHTHASAAIVLTVIAIEAYRNIICYLKNHSVTKTSKVSNDFSNEFSSIAKNFPAEILTSLLEEIFVVRDVIVHNHIYELEVSTGTDWKIVSNKQKLLKGYGQD